MSEVLEQIEQRGIKIGMEKGMEKGRAEGMEKGRAEGMEKGENKLGTLIDRLLRLGRSGDVARAATDSEYRQQLYQEFQIA